MAEYGDPHTLLLRDDGSLNRMATSMGDAGSAHLRRKSMDSFRRRGIAATAAMQQKQQAQQGQQRQQGQQEHPGIPSEPCGGPAATTRAALPTVAEDVATEDSWPQSPAAESSSGGVAAGRRLQSSV